MANRAGVALKVFDLDASIAFSTRFLKFELMESQPDVGIACLRDSDGDLILLVAPSQTDPRRFLAEPRLVFKPGDTLSFVVDNLDIWHSELVEKGLEDARMRIEENEHGERKLLVSDLDGYHFAFMAPIRRSPEAMIASYRGLNDDLAAALDGLTEADLDLQRAPEEWSIRQILHHLALSASLFLMPIETALVNPGKAFVLPPYDQEQWVEVLDYRHQPVETSLVLIRSVQAHITRLLLHVPNPWEHTIVRTRGDHGEDEGQTITLRDMISIQIEHTMAHLDEIRQIRTIHHR